jgi:hypothetical protein
MCYTYITLTQHHYQVYDGFQLTWVRQVSADILFMAETQMVELTTPEGHTYRVGRLSHEERNQKILRYRQKRHERNFTKRIKYQCRKTLADSRPRVRGRFARNNDEGAVLPHETKKAMKARVKQEQVQAHAGESSSQIESKFVYSFK